MVVTTVIVSGIPQYVTLTDLAYSLDRLFAEDEIGDFHLRDSTNHSRTNERQIAIDFDASYDAVIAQTTLNGYEYQLPNGREYTLRAKITKNEPSVKEIGKQIRSPSPERISYKRRYHRDNKQSVIPNIYFQRDSGAQMLRLNDNLDTKIDVLKKQKKILAMERKLLKEKKKLKKEMEDSDSFDSEEEGAVVSIKKSRSKRKKSRRSRSVSRSRKSRRFKSPSSTSFSSDSSDSSRERRRRRKYYSRNRRSSDHQRHRESRSVSRERHARYHHRAKNSNRSRSRCCNSRSRYRGSKSQSLDHLQSPSAHYRKSSRSRTRELEGRRRSRSNEDRDRPSTSSSHRKSSTKNIDSVMAVAFKEASKVLMKERFEMMLYKIVLQENLKIPSKDMKAIQLLLTKAIERKLESMLNGISLTTVSNIVKRFLHYFDDRDSIKLIRKVLDNFRNNSNEIENPDDNHALVSVSTAKKRNSSRAIITAECNDEIIDLDNISVDELLEDSQQILPYCPNPSLLSKDVRYTNSTNEITLDTPLLPPFVPCVSTDVVNNIVPENPRFILPTRAIIKQMKSALSELELNSENGHIFVVRRIIRRKLRVIMAGKEYMSTSSIVKLFREHHPRTSDKEFLQNIMNDIKTGLYDDDKDSDLENRPADNTKAIEHNSVKNRKSKVVEEDKDVSTPKIKIEPSDNITVEVFVESSNSDMTFKSEAPLTLESPKIQDNTIEIMDKETNSVENIETEFPSNHLNNKVSTANNFKNDIIATGVLNKGKRIVNNSVENIETDVTTSYDNNENTNVNKGFEERSKDHRKAYIIKADKQNSKKNHGESSETEKREDMPVLKVKSESTESDVTVEVLVESSNRDMNFKSEPSVTSDVAEMQDSRVVISTIEIMDDENDNGEKHKTNNPANSSKNSVFTVTENESNKIIGAKVTVDTVNTNLNKVSEEKTEGKNENMENEIYVIENKAEIIIIDDESLDTVNVEIKVEDDYDATNIKKNSCDLNGELILSNGCDHSRYANVDHDIERIALNEDKITENGNKLEGGNKKKIHTNQNLDEVVELKRKAQEDIDSDKDENTRGIFTVTFNRDDEFNRSTEDLLKILSDD